MWHWGTVRNIWRGSGTELYEYVRVLLHLQQNLIRRQVEQKDSSVFLRVATHALFMAFPAVHDVCYVKGR